MEELTCVHFLKEEAVGYRNRRNEPIYHIETGNRQFGDYFINHITVYLPIYQYRGFRKKLKNWTEDAYEAYLQKVPIPPEGSRVCYLKNECESLSFEWILFLISYYQRKYQKQKDWQTNFTELVILDDRDLPIEELIEFFVEKVEKIILVTSQAERYEHLSEKLYEEYGFLLEIVSSAKDLIMETNPFQGKKLLNIPSERSEEISGNIRSAVWKRYHALCIIAGNETYNLSPNQIPVNHTVFINTVPGNQQNRMLISRAKECVYISLEDI